ncbi:MAG: hypothetical protein JXB36_00365, partial [Gammaproteobacteria bacterium]|nr:hypothetical protein [Gammaproteobacteria bacterium]
MPIHRAVLLLAALAAANAASALTIEYGERGDALAACDAAMYRGERADATQCYRRLLEQSGDARIMAEAARALDDVRTANSHFQTAVEQHPDDPAVRTRWGMLFLETHQNNEAVQLFLEALERDPEHVAA